MSVADDIVSKIAPGTVPLRTHELYVSTLTREERLRIFDEVRAQLNQNKQKQQDPFLYQDLDETSKQTSSGTAEHFHSNVLLGFAIFRNYYCYFFGNFCMLKTRLFMLIEIPRSVKNKAAA